MLVQRKHTPDVKSAKQNDSIRRSLACASLNAYTMFLNLLLNLLLTLLLIFSPVGDAEKRSVLGGRPVPHV